MVATFLKLIRQIRIQKNYSQEFMATQLYFTQSYYAKIERGKTKLSAELLFRILDILELDYVGFFKQVKKEKIGFCGVKKNSTK